MTRLRQYVRLHRLPMGAQAAVQLALSGDDQRNVTAVPFVIENPNGAALSPHDG